VRKRIPEAKKRGGWHHNSNSYEAGNKSASRKKRVAKMGISAKGGNKIRKENVAETVLASTIRSRP